MDRLNVSKWMRYEDDILKYYYPSLIEWIDDEHRKPSQTAFTAGLARQIANLIEHAIREGKNNLEKERVKQAIKNFKHNISRPIHKNQEEVPIRYVLAEIEEIEEELKL